MKPIMALSLLFVMPAMAHAMPPAEQDEWRQDLAVYTEEVTARHMNAFHTMSEREFIDAIARLESELPNLTPEQAVAGLMRVHHALGDGHSAIPLWEIGYRRYPVEFRLIDGELIIIGAGAGMEHALGHAVGAINDQSVARVVDTLRPYAPFVENTGSEAVRVARYLTVPELMLALGVADTADTMTLTLETHTGATTIELSAVPGSAYSNALVHRLDYRHPLDDDDVLARAPGLSFSFHPESSLGYIRFDSYPAAAEMDRFAGEVVDLMNTAGGRNIAIDFRDNYGGDFYTGLRLAHALNLLDGVEWADGVYVLTSSVTFSAAMSNSAQFSDVLNARRVGEATGANPCGYQDMGQFNLPNSGLLVTYSKRFFCFAEAENDALQPDQLVPVTADHWREGVDAGFDWIVEDIANRRS